ncbi:MAG: ABC transporter substrate-binding protein [Synechococcaceae cyanobacterium]|nr:ABC transporter substrate-binding protein [Synechococcaceae cyanobacterium]
MLEQPDRYQMAVHRRRFLALMLVAAGGSMLLSACGRKDGVTAAKVSGPTVAMLQAVDSPPPNEVRRGFIEALAKAGYVQGKTINFIQKDAAGELPNTTLIMKQFVGDKADLIFAIGTPPLQAAMKEIPAGTPVVFAYSSNPWGAGAGTAPGGVGQHRPNVVGTIGTNPVDKELDLAMEMVPGLKTVGMIYNPGEPNSEFEAKILKQAAAKRGIKVEEQSVANSGEVLQAAEALAQKKVQAFVKIGDYATIQGFGSIAKVGLKNKIPVFSVDADDIKLPGTLATLGWAYYDDGYAAGQLAVKVLKGESPAKMAFLPLSKIDININRSTANAIALKLNDGVLKKATKVVD